MVQPQKSRSRRRVYVKSSKGTKLVYKQRKSAKRTCNFCGKPLHGVAAVTRKALKKLTKSQKRPERKFGGVLCSSCSRLRIIQEVRGKNG